MKQIIGFIKAYYYEVDKLALAGCTAFMALFIGLNYTYHLEAKVIRGHSFLVNPFFDQFLIYMLAFLIPYFIIGRLPANKRFGNPALWACILLAPLLFAIKVRLDTTIFFMGDPQWNSYWNDIFYWPLRMIILLLSLAFCKSIFHKGENRC